MPHPLVVHSKKVPFDIYIGRGHGSILGNPFSHQVGTLAQFKVGSRKEAITRFESYARERMKTDVVFRAEIRACHMKVLGCWCAPKQCHGEIIVKLAAELVAEEQAA